MAIRSGLLAGALTLAACGPGGGTIELAWTGADTGQATLPATALRCGAGPVELLGMSGDTGIAIALYSDGGGAARTGAYRVSEHAAGAARPAASLGARWLDSSTVLAWRGASGEVALSAAGAEMAGTFAVQASRMDRTDSVTLRGSFRGVAVGPCGADSAGAGSVD